MNFPAELKYTKDHEWVKMLDDTTALVGISDFAQSELGDLVFVNLPAVGDDVVAGEAACDVESVKAVSDVMSPVTGSVAEVNEELDDSPELLNSDPYGAWIMKIEKDDLKNEVVSAFAQPILDRVSAFRAASKKKATQQYANRPFEFPEDRHFAGRKLFVPQLMSEGRDYVTCGLLEDDCLVLAPHFQAPANELHVLALISSRLHAVWVEAVCG